MRTANPRKSDPALVWDQLLTPPRKSRGNLSRQLVTSFIDAIDDKQIPEGVRLPSSRTLSRSLNVGRNTVIAAINTLIEQGYLASKDRSGIFVAVNKEVARKPLSLSRPGEIFDWQARLAIARPENHRTAGDSFEVPVTHYFKYGQFDFSTFPTGHWRECERSASAFTEIAEWGRDAFDRDDAGLIESLRKHVLPNHGIWAKPDEILVTLGGQEGRYLVAQLLSKAGVTVGMENPGMTDMNEILSATAARRIWLPVDRDGVCLSAELKQCDVVFLTPGHQCPTTAVMPHENRLALLDLARRRDMVVVEDTYQTEIISPGKVTPSLKSLDREGRVIHIGSLSKSVAPGLRIGYVVASPPVVQELRAIRRLIHRHPPGNIQRALAMFIDRGYYQSYLRKISVGLNRRTETLLASLKRWLPDAVTRHCDGASTVWIEFARPVDCARLCAEVRSHGILLEAGDRYFFQKPRKNCLLMAVSQIQADKIDQGVQKIASVRRAMATGR